MLKGKNRREGEREREEEAAPVVQEGRKFVYILVGFTRECLSRQTAAGLPSQQLINNTHTHIAHTHTPLSFSLFSFLPPSPLGKRRSALVIVRNGKHDLLFATLKLQPGTFLKEEVVFVCSVCCFSLSFFKRKRPRWQFQSTTAILFPKIQSFVLRDVQKAPLSQGQGDSDLLLALSLPNARPSTPSCGVSRGRQCVNYSDNYIFLICIFEFCYE